MRIRARNYFVVLAVSTAGMVFAQDSLTLNQALFLARENNGTVRSAFLDYEASRAAIKTAGASFFPTVTPQFSRQWGETESFTGFGKGRTDTTQNSAFLDVNWQLWDNGSRRINVRRAELNAEGSELSALQTLRATLFSVQTRFYDSLRTQKLLEVQLKNVERAKAILDETEARTKPPIEDLPRKDVYQARADYQNAVVGRLTALNRVSTSSANLKAVLGWEAKELPTLVEPTDLAVFPEGLELDAAIEEGLINRPDLTGARKRELAQMETLRSTKLQSGIQYSVDANYRRGMLEDAFQSSALVFSASIPLYDGARSKENVRIQELTLESIRSSLLQQELDAKAEIESAYLEFSQNLMRLEAAKVAYEAAKINYDLTQEAYSQYRAATLVERLTAQVTLTTAESNLVEATYDTLISEVRLKIAMGRPLAGETLSEGE